MNKENNNNNKTPKYQESFCKAVPLGWSRLLRHVPLSILEHAIVEAALFKAFVF